MSSEMGDMWRAHNAAKADRKRQRLFDFDTEGWTQRSPYHFQRTVAGHLLDHWPSTNKWRYRGRTYFSGDVLLFISAKERQAVPGDAEKEAVLDAAGVPDGQPDDVGTGETGAPLDYGIAQHSEPGLGGAGLAAGGAAPPWDVEDPE